MLMLRLLRADGSIEEVEQAETAELEGEELICRNEQGRPVARYDKHEITIYGLSKESADQAKTDQPEK